MRYMSVYAVLMAIVLVCPAHATTYLVEPDGSGDFPTIQAAIDAAGHGDIIELGDGVFTGIGNRDLDYSGKLITVRSVSGDPELCIIDCEATSVDRHVGFHFQTGPTALSVLEGITIRNGYSIGGGGVYCNNGTAPTISNCVFRDNNAVEDGGAIRCRNGSTPEIVNCQFYSNTAVWHGGAIFWDDAGEMIVTNCQFEGNSARRGAGICISELVSDYSAFVTDCTFVENTAWEGGGIYSANENHLIVERCVFSRNRALTSWGGGGAHCDHPEDAEFIDCIFEGNVVEGFDGGALSTYWGSMTLRGCTFSGNSAINGESGGAVFCYYAIMDLHDCLFELNTAEGHGGAFYHLGRTASMTSCTFNANQAGEGGGAIAAFDPVILTNCTLAYNGAPNGGQIKVLEESLVASNTILAFGTGGAAIDCIESGTATLNCCDVFGNEGGDWVGCIADQYGINGNIALDPLFCNPVGGEFQLEEGSPCAPFSPPNTECDLIGAWPVGCIPTSGIADESPDAIKVPSSWGGIKAAYR